MNITIPKATIIFNSNGENSSTHTITVKSVEDSLTGLRAICFLPDSPKRPRYDGNGEARDTLNILITGESIDSFQQALSESKQGLVIETIQSPPERLDFIEYAQKFSYMGTLRR